MAKKIDLQRVKRLLKKHHGILSPVAKALKIPRTELRELIGKSADLRKALAEAQDSLVEFAIERLIDLLQQNDPLAIAFIKRYAVKMKVK